MPIVRVRNFQGYSSKSDDIVNDGRVAKFLINAMINKGDITNLPHLIAFRDWATALPPTDTRNFTGNKLGTIAKIEQKQLFIAYNAGDFVSGSSIIISLGDILADTYRQIIIEPTDMGLTDNVLFPSGFFAKNATPWNDGNAIQIGNTVYFLCQTALTKSNIPRMIRVSLQKRTGTNSLFNEFKISPIGIESPTKVELSSRNFFTSGGSVNGEFELAITVVSNVDGMEAELDAALGLKFTRDELTQNALESNPIFFTPGSKYIGGLLGLKISLPRFHSGLEGPHEPSLRTQRGLIGIYARDIAAGEVTFSFQGYFETNDLQINNFVTSVEIATDINLTFNSNKVPPQGDHSVVQPAIHAAFFRNRMYYSYLFTKKPLLPGGIIGSQPPNNTMQISKSTIAEASELNAIINDLTIANDNSIKAVNYIEKLEPVGMTNEPITGLIEFQSQLIIFKQTETYVLNQDINIGTIRKLFSNRGCVNVTGGRAYLVIDEKLFFGDATGIYMFDGQNEPIKISSPIDEDLRVIPEERYNFMRLSIDDRYGLLYVIFPPTSINDDTISTFIFHYRQPDFGKWTKMDNSFSQSPPPLLDVLVARGGGAPDNEIYYLTTTDFGRVGLITDAPISTSKGRPILIQFDLDGGDLGRFKLWKSVNFLFTTGANLGIHVSLLNDASSTIKSITSSNDRIYVGLHQELLHMKILETVSSLLFSNPFRLTGYDITVLGGTRGG